MDDGIDNDCDGLIDADDPGDDDTGDDDTGDDDTGDDDTGDDDTDDDDTGDDDTGDDDDADDDDMDDDDAVGDDDLSAGADCECRFGDRATKPGAALQLSLALLTAWLARRLRR